MTRAVALISGGLDSILAAMLIKNQGIDVIGLCFKSAFFGDEDAQRMAKQAGIPLAVIDFTDEHIEMTKNPKHGYGKNMNPCIDCHALMIKRAGKFMEKVGADFLITGEVLNQRPMSQNLQSLGIVSKESGYEEKILRPLSALNLPPTEMEVSGLVDRKRLMGVKGRSRKSQMELAEKLNVHDYPTPAGGCKLTEPGFSRRLKDLYTYKKDFTIDDISLLKIGRHFRLTPDVKVISTRDEKELEMIKPLIEDSDIVFDTVDFSGSTIIVKGNPAQPEIYLAASITARYSKGNSFDSVKVRYGMKREKEYTIIEVKPISETDILKYML